MALAGYNPNMSLLPQGNGSIQAMSGGGMAPPSGFNPNVSLLPSAGGDINSYRGGFMNDPIQIIPESSSSLTGGANIPKGVKEVEKTSDSITVTWDNFDPKGRTYSGEAVPPLPTVPTVPADGTLPKPLLAKIKATIDYTKQTAIFSGLAPNTSYKIVIRSGTLSGSDNPTITTLPKEDKPVNSADKPADKPAENAAAADKPAENASNAANKSRPITLFGTDITLTNPKKMNTDKFTDDQITALQKFGLDGPGLSTKEKFDIIQAIYDGKCNTDQPMIFLQNCEPIRRVVQALALNLLEKLQANDSEDQLGIKKDEQPSVEYKQTNDKGMRICITFKPDQLGLLSKFAPKTTKKKNKSGPKPPAAAVPPVPPAPPIGSIKPSITETHTATSIVATFSKALKDDKSVDPDVTYKVSLKKGDVNATTNGATSNSKNSDDGTTTTVTFSSLKPNTDYTIEVIATKGSQIETSTLPVKTTELTIPPTENNGESSVGSEGSEENNGESSVSSEGSEENGESSVGSEGSEENNGESSVSSEGSEENNGESSVSSEGSEENGESSVGSEESEENGESSVSSEGSEENGNKSLTEEELNNLLAELLEELEELNLPTNKAQKIDQFKGKELTPEELKEIDEILASLSATNIPSDSPITLEELKKKLEEIKKGMTTNKNNKTQGGYNIFTTKGIINSNPSVSCYCISTIQMLYSIPEIRNAILNYDCSGLTLDETTINNISDSSIKNSINAKYKEKANVNEVIDGKMVFCALNKIFEQLNTSTSTFDKLDQTTADTLLDTAGDKKITNTYVKYIMKLFIAYMNKNIEEKNKKIEEENKKKGSLPLTPTIPLETINKQQNLTDFLTIFIIPLMENDKILLPISNIFNFREDTIYTCEQNSTNDPRKKEPTTGTTEKIINLGISNYIDNKDIPTMNKYKKGTEMFSLDKILDYSQTIESMTDDNALMGCGPKNTTPGAKNNGETKGPGTKRNTYIIPDENRYLLVYTNRPRFDIASPQERIFNLNEKLFINPEITVSNKLYHIFGSVLYSPGGTERPPQSKILVQAANRSGGHYIYDRFYLTDDSNPANTSSANDLPFVVYNDERVLFKNTDINIDNKSYLIVYRFVKNLDKSQIPQPSMTGSDEEQATDPTSPATVVSEPGEEQNVGQTPAPAVPVAPVSTNGADEENINPNIQREIDERKAKNRQNAEKSLKNNSNEQARIKAEQNAIAAKKVANNAKKAANNAKRAERAKPGPEASVNSQGLFGNITDNNFVSDEPVKSNARPTINIPNNNPNNIITPPENGTAPKKNITNKQYKAQNVKIFSGKLSKLQQDLEVLQRAKRTPERAAKIQSILSNIQILKGETGKNSKTIKNTLTRIQQKYTNINKQKRLTLGGKRTTFKKAALKRKRTTMKKQRK